MKKVAFLLLGAIMIFMFGAINASAQTVVEERPIYGKITYESALPEFPVSNGGGGGTLPDGTEIAVSGVPNGAVTLVVNKIDHSETEPYAWFKQVLGNKGSVMQAYEIYFLDADRNRIAAEGAGITVSIPGNMEEPKVYSVTPAGSYGALGATIAGGKISFTTDGSHYYVLAGIGFEEYRDKILDIIDGLHEPDEDEVRKDRIDEAHKEVEDYVYDPDKSYEENKEELDKILEELTDDLDDLEDFEDYRDKVLDAAEGLHEPGEDADRKELIDRAEQAIKEYEYDFDKTLEENEDALYDILRELCKELDTKVPYIPKTGDDTALILWLVVAACSFTAFLVLLIQMRRKEEEDEAEEEA